MVNLACNIQKTAGHEAIFLLYVCIIIIVECDKDIDGQCLQPALSDFQYKYSHFQYFAQFFSNFQYLYIIIIAKSSTYNVCNKLSEFSVFSKFISNHARKLVKLLMNQ